MNEQKQSEIKERLEANEYYPRNMWGGKDTVGFYLGNVLMEPEYLEKRLNEIIPEASYISTRHQGFEVRIIVHL